LKVLFGPQKWTHSEPRRNGVSSKQELDPIGAVLWQIPELSVVPVGQDATHVAPSLFGKLG
jgi:hypothetical protein